MVRNPGGNRAPMKIYIKTLNFISKRYVRLSRFATRQQVMSLMSLFGDVVGLKVCGKEQNKPCAIVQFSTAEQATNAIAYLHTL